MKISSKSWHYRLHVLVFTVWNWNYGPFPYFDGRRYKHEPKNLCGYFWSTLILTILTLIFGLGFGIILGFLFVVWGISEGISWLYRKYRQIRPKSEVERVIYIKPPKQPGIVRSFVRAKKQKVCPLIEVVKGDE